MIGPFVDDIKLWGTNVFYRSDYEGCNFIAAFDLITGKLLWYNFLITTDYLLVSQSFFDQDKNIMISGYFDGVIQDTTVQMESAWKAFFVCKLSSANGAILWCKSDASVSSSDVISGACFLQAKNLFYVVRSFNQQKIFLKQVRLSINLSPDS